jgi:hypothetical protein
MSSTQCPDPPACKPGSYSSDGKNGWGARACQLCPAGTHSGSAGATSCSPCTAAAGTYCPEGSTTDTAVTCPVGFSCTGGAEDKVECPEGWNTVATGASECLPDCNAGHSFLNGSCVPCPVPATFDEARLYAVPAGIVFGYQCVSFVQVQAWFSRTQM